MRSVRWWRVVVDRDRPADIQKPAELPHMIDVTFVAPDGRIELSVGGNTKKCPSTETSEKGAIMSSVLVWADIPVTDMDRAMKFYGHVLQTELLQPFPGQPVAVPPPDMGPVAFDLVMGDDHKPSATEGTTVYLSAMGDIDGMAKRVEEAGGQIVMPPTDMGEMVGFICFFIDSEGNRIGIQQPGQGKS